MLCARHRDIEMDSFYFLLLFHFRAFRYRNYRVRSNGNACNGYKHFISTTNKCRANKAKPQHFFSTMKKVLLCVTDVFSPLSIHFSSYGVQYTATNTYSRRFKRCFAYLHLIILFIEMNKNVLLHLQKQTYYFTCTCVCVRGACLCHTC